MNGMASSLLSFQFLCQIYVCCTVNITEVHKNVEEPPVSKSALQSNYTISL